MSIYVDDDARSELSKKQMQTGAAWIFPEEDAKEKFYWPYFELEAIVKVITINLNITGTILFALMESKKNFCVVPLAASKFVVCVDVKHFYQLLQFCIRLQTLPGLAEELGFDPIAVNKDFSQKYLLDILKQFLNDKFLPSARITGDMVPTRAALINIIGHEIAHVAHGHNEFIVSQEFLSFPEGEDRNLTLKALEMDADSSGVTSVFTAYENIIASAFGKGETENLSEKQFWRKYLKLAVAGIHFSALFRDALTTDFQPRKYPNGYERFMLGLLISEIVLGAHMDENKDLPESVRKSIVSAFATLSGSASTLFHPIAANASVLDLETGEKEFIYSDLVIDHVKASITSMEARWSRIRPMLEKFHRGGRLAPAIVPPQ